MKESPHITLTKEQEKRDTIHCAMWASIVVLGMLALFLHGMAFLSWTEPTMEEIYRNKRLEEEIILLKKDINYLSGQCVRNNTFKNHKHHFWTGKIKKEVIK